MSVRVRAGMAVAAVIAAVMAAASGAAAGPDKVALCHWSEDDQSYVSIEVAAVAAERHLSQHEHDLLIGGPVSEACEQATTVFARAFSIDATGAEVLIAQLEDTNGDGAITAGDTVRTNQYPLDFGPTGFGTFQVTEHEVASVQVVSQTRVHVNSVTNYAFTFAGGPGHEQYTEIGQGVTQMLDDGPSFFVPDEIVVNSQSPSAPDGGFHLRGRNLSDDTFLEVELSVPAP